jgi:hypothetical protein
MQSVMMSDICSSLNLLPRKRCPTEESSKQIVTAQERQDTDCQERERDVLGNEGLSVDKSSLFTELDCFSCRKAQDTTDDYSQGDLVAVRRAHRSAFLSLELKTCWRIWVRRLLNLQPGWKCRTLE